MARSDRRTEPVSDEAFESMPERIGEHFDRIRSLLERETEDFEG